MAVKIGFISYDLVFGDGRRQKRRGEVSGYVKSRQEIVDRILHPFPGAKVENLKQTDEAYKVVSPQPEELAE